jgi:RNA polymerase sigma factor (TIGR02999 family)
MAEITELLTEWTNGNKDALNKLIPLVYNELHYIAHRHLRKENSSLQTSALINELYLQFVKWEGANWNCRGQFFGVSARIMRNIMVDYARKRDSLKRGGDYQRISLDDALNILDEKSISLTELDDALNSLEKIDAKLCQIIELRFFCGLTCQEVAEILGTSAATVHREETIAKHWLLRELKRK